MVTALTADGNAFLKSSLVDLQEIATVWIVTYRQGDYGIDFYKTVS